MSVNAKAPVYYSQNREDLILESFFPDLKQGFYVDVGAYDPDYDSVTKKFYVKGWHGINIEPQPGQYQRFVKRRKRDTNLNVGISDKKGKATLRVYPSKGLSTFSQEIKQQYKETGERMTDKFEDITVPVTTLSDILKQHAEDVIHFLKVDVEGREYEVLRSNDWKRFRPKIVCIEANRQKGKDWPALLRQNHYKLVFFDGLNEYYRDKTDRGLGDFNYIDHILLDLHGGMRVEDYQRIVKLEKLSAKYADLVENYQSHLDGLNAKIEAMEKDSYRTKKDYKNLLAYIRRVIKGLRRRKHDADTD